MNDGHHTYPVLSCTTSNSHNDTDNNNHADNDNKKKENKVVVVVVVVVIRSMEQLLGPDTRLHSSKVPGLSPAMILHWWRG